jgi:hypothetical protein
LFFEQPGWSEVPLVNYIIDDRHANRFLNYSWSLRILK